jgi:hypothetical protein
MKQLKLLILGLCLNLNLQAQTSLEELKSIVSYIKNISVAEIPESFFDDSTAAQGCIYYVYVSYADQIKSAALGKFYYFYNDKTKAVEKQNSLKQLGHHTLLFETPSNIGCYITECLLQLQPAEAAFMVLHESIHFTFMRNQYRISRIVPDSAEEAFCDLLANYYLSDCKLINQKAYKRLRRKNEKIYRIINKTLTTQISHATAQKRIHRKLKHASPFLKQRFHHEVNHAFLLRYKHYTSTYFELKKRLGISRKNLPSKEELIILLTQPNK